jgi:hypothetical protein
VERRLSHQIRKLSSRIEAAEDPAELRMLSAQLQGACNSRTYLRVVVKLSLTAVGGRRRSLM